MPPQTIAITGVDGFVGRHVARAAAERGHRVIGVSRAKEAPSEIAELLASYASADLTEAWPVTEKPDAVIHLAGLAAVGPSFEAPQRYIEANSAIVTTMCESLRAHGGPPPRVVGVSSGAVYEVPSDDEPLDESAPTGESSPYVVSKLLMEHQLAYYRRRGIDSVVVRPFNHIGPGQSGGYLLPDLASRVRTSRDGVPMSVGNLHTRRDYTDVRDVAQAYVLIATAPAHAHTVYNVSSGIARSGEEILAAICEELGVGVPEIHTDPALLRPTDAMSIRGNAGRLAAEYGWTPRFSLRQTIADFLRHE